MIDEKFILVSMDDLRSKRIADALGNKTCRKIIDYLAEKDDASAKDLSDALGIPLNTLNYNLKILLDSEIVEKKKNFFWSRKGKKIVMYGLSNKSIIISPKKRVSSKLKSILPVAILTGALTFAVYVYNKILLSSQNAIYKTNDFFMGVSESSKDAVDNFVNDVPTYNPSILFNDFHGWIWFLGGAVLVLIIFSILNWRKL